MPCKLYLKAVEKKAKQETEGVTYGITVEKEGKNTD